MSLGLYMNVPAPVCNYLVILATGIVSYFGFRDWEVEAKCIFNPERILGGKEYRRLVTSAFLHADWRHLILNMISLFFFGPAIEFFLGRTQFLVIYFGAVIGGNLLSLYVHRHHEYRAYGASGGVCGIMFAYILLFPGASIASFYFPVPVPGWLYAIGYILFSFYGMKEHNRGNIGHDAHLGGAIIGFLLTAALSPDHVRQNLKVFLIVLGVALALLVYLWVNPLFLPVASFFNRATRTRGKSSSLPGHKRESLQLDAVLEKISKSGMESLTSEEKNLLGQVSAKYQRRGESKKPESGLAI